MMHHPFTSANEHSMTRSWWSLPCVLCLALVTCARDATFTEPLPAYAAINFVNAVADTSKMAFRIIDIASNAGLYAAPFRGASTFPMGIEAGSRHIRVFLDTTDVVLAKTVMLDTTYMFAGGEHYSFLLTGFSRAGQSPTLRAMVTSDGALPAPGPGKFAIRVVNLAPSFAGSPAPLADTMVHADVFVRRVESVPGGTPEGVDLAYRAASSYAVLDTGRYRIALTATGTAGPAIVQAAVPVGGGTPTIAGSLAAGSVLTAVIGPRAVAGSRAPQGGRPSAKAVEAITRSGDTVTVQSGSTSSLVNRSPTKPDSVVGTTGTGASTGVARGDVVLISGATEVEYNGWQVVLAQADSLSCSPADARDTGAKCAATNATATTQFRYRYRIAGTPTSPATGTSTYRVYAASYSAGDFTTPAIFYVVDRRP
jgi:hypothetical protein